MGNVLPPAYSLWIPTWTLDGSTKIFQTVHMLKDDVAGAPAAINASMRTFWAAAARPYNAAQMYVGYTLAKTETYVNTDGVITYDLDETPIIGTLSSSLGTPINTSILVKKNTNVVGRRYRGRHMFPNLWVPEANISQAGIITTGGVSTLQALFTAAITAQIAGGLDPYLGHSVSEVAPTAYTTVSVQPKIGTMRRRIRGF